jgi:hypothetical protein
VIGANLHELFDAPTMQPRGEGGVQLRAIGLREAGIGDLADEDVLEPERLLGADRRARLLLDKIP